MFPMFSKKTTQRFGGLFVYSDTLSLFPRETLGIMDLPFNPNPQRSLVDDKRTP